MQKKKNLLPAMPILLWMGLFVGVPLIYALSLSVMTRGPMGNVVFKFTLDNFARIFDPLYIGIFVESMLMALLTSVITLLVGYPFAYFAAKVHAKHKFSVLLLVMIPFWTSSLLRTYGWIMLLANNGIVNTVLLGFVDEPIRFLYNFGAVLVGTVYMLLPFMILSVYNSVDKLDFSLLEASYDLGAGRFETFVKITLPMTLPGIVGGITLVFIPAVGMFFISDLLGGAKTLLLGNLIRNQIQSARNWPFAAALSVVMVICVLLLIALYRKLQKNAHDEGGLF